MSKREISDEMVEAARSAVRIATFCGDKPECPMCGNHDGCRTIAKAALTAALALSPPPAVERGRIVEACARVADSFAGKVAPPVNSLHPPPQTYRISCDIAKAIRALSLQGDEGKGASPVSGYMTAEEIAAVKTLIGPGHSTGGGVLSSTQSPRDGVK